MEKVSPTAPDNLENYLARIDSCKEEIRNLDAKILTLKQESTNIENHNVEAFRELQDNIHADLKEAAELLKAAKSKDADSADKLLEASDIIAKHNEAISAHEKEKEDFAEQRKNTIDSLRLAQDEVSKLKEDSTVIALELNNKEKAHNEKELALEIRAQQQSELHEQLQSLSQNNQSESNRIENSKADLNLQMQQIHKDIAESTAQRKSDIEEQRVISQKTEADKQSNQAILDEINERANRLQELILNQKIMSKSIDNKMEVLRGQEEKNREMINTLQSLKDELSKDSKSQEVVK